MATKEDLEKRVATLEKELDDMRGAIRGLSTQLNTQAQSIAALTNDTSALKSEQKSLYVKFAGYTPPGPRKDQSTMR